MAEPRTYLPNPVADPGQTVLPAPYQPKRKGFFLSHLIRAAQSTPELRGLNVEEGNLWHRIMSVFAEALERQSHIAAETAVWAIREGAYRAWYDADLFPSRTPATYARGTVILSLGSAPATDDLILKGTLLGAADGRTVSVEADTVFAAGTTRAFVDVVASLPGSMGNMEAGTLTSLMGGGARYTVSQPAPISGGQDEETDEALYGRFQDYVESRSTGNRLAVYSAARNARVWRDGEVVEAAGDVAVIYPWAMPGMSGEMGFGYVVMDNGSGGASASLVAKAQDNVDRVQSAMERHEVIPASTYLVRPQVRAYATRTADGGAVQAALRTVWTEYASTLRIEDGQGRGRMSLYDLGQRLDRAHPDLLQVVFLNLDGDVLPPLGSRVVAGEMTIDLRRGEVVRPWA